MNKDLCILVVDGGVLRHGTPEAHAYGSAQISTREGMERVRWDSLPTASTSPEAEYDALIAALEFCWGLFSHWEKFPKIQIRMDANLVVQQVGGNWRVLADNLKPRWTRVKELLEPFSGFEMVYIKEAEVKQILGH